jgi:hypothetical protein
MRIACCVSKATRAHAHVNALAKPHVFARTHAHKHGNIYFPRQQLLSERASVLRYT